MATNIALRILVDVLVKKNIILKRRLEQANAENAETKEEMTKRDVDQLTSLIGPLTQSSYKGQIRVLNTCECCPRHMSKRIKPEDLDKEEIVHFPNTTRSDEELRVEIDNCACNCRQYSRFLYREYLETCIVCVD